MKSSNRLRRASWDVLQTLRANRCPYDTFYQMLSKGQESALCALAARRASKRDTRTIRQMLEWNAGNSTLEGVFNASSASVIKALLELAGGAE
jgi:hypothetical protein